MVHSGHFEICRILKFAAVLSSLWCSFNLQRLQFYTKNGGKIRWVLMFAAFLCSWQNLRRKNAKTRINQDILRNIGQKNLGPLDMFVWGHRNGVRSLSSTSSMTSYTFNPTPSISLLYKTFHLVFVFLFVSSFCYRCICHTLVSVQPVSSLLLVSLYWSSHVHFWCYLSSRRQPTLLFSLGTGSIEF